jgi:hypothetical protein
VFGACPFRLHFNVLLTGSFLRLHPKRIPIHLRVSLLTFFASLYYVFDFVGTPPSLLHRSHSSADGGDTHASTLRTESCSNRPFRRLYIDPTPRRPSAIPITSPLSDVSPINTRVSCPIARGWSLVPHQFRGLVSHISPLKHYSKLVSTVRNNRHIDIDTIATE